MTRLQFFLPLNLVGYAMYCIDERRKEREKTPPGIENNCGLWLCFDQEEKPVGDVSDGCRLIASVEVYSRALLGDCAFLERVTLLLLCSSATEGIQLEFPSVGHTGSRSRLQPCRTHALVALTPPNEMPIAFVPFSKA